MKTNNLRSQMLLVSKLALLCDRENHYGSEKQLFDKLNREQRDTTPLNTNFVTKNHQINKQYNNSEDKMIVMKFGGTSVGSADAIKRTCSIIAARAEQKPYVVVSALSGITDKLLEAANIAKEGIQDNCAYEEIKQKHYEVLEGLELPKDLVDKELEKLKGALTGISYLQELTPRTTDFIVSFGEQCSSRIVAAYLEKTGHKSQAYTGWEAGIITDSDHMDASFLQESYERISHRMRALDHIPIITGFIAKDNLDEITTLGRGGSDLTASIIGAGIGAEEIQIWTDVNGIMTCDPRICKNAVSLDVVSAKEASELAFFGAKILHPKTISPAVKKDIPVVVKNSFEPDNPGTRVLGQKEKQRNITAIAIKKNITEITIESSRMLNAPGFMSRIFNVFDEESISVDLVATSEVSVSITLDNKNGYSNAVERLKEIGHIKVNQNLSIICVVGDGISNNPKLKGDIISCFGQNDIPIEMISHGASSINIGIVVKDEHANKAAAMIHDNFVI